MKHSLIEIVHKSKRMLYKCTELWCFLLAWFFLHKSTFCWSVFEANELLSKLPANIIPNPIHEMHFKSAKRLKLRIESSAEVIFYFLKHPEVGEKRIIELRENWEGPLLYSFGSKLRSLLRPKTVLTCCGYLVDRATHMLLMLHASSRPRNAYFDLIYYFISLCVRLWNTRARAIPMQNNMNHFHVDSCLLLAFSVNHIYSAFNVLTVRISFLLDKVATPFIR